MVASFSLRKERVSESVLHKVGIIYRDCDSVCVCSSDCVAHLFFKQQMSLALLLLCVCVCVRACVCVIHPGTKKLPAGHPTTWLPTKNCQKELHLRASANTVEILFTRRNSVYMCAERVGALDGLLLRVPPSSLCRLASQRFADKLGVTILHVVIPLVHALVSAELHRAVCCLQHT
jgi:hypothetical protein